MLHYKPGLLGMDRLCILSTASPQWNMATSLSRAYKQLCSRAIGGLLNRV